MSDAGHTEPLPRHGGQPQATHDEDRHEAGAPGLDTGEAMVRITAAVQAVHASTDISGGAADQTSGADQASGTEPAASVGQVPGSGPGPSQVHGTGQPSDADRNPSAREPLSTDELLSALTLLRELRSEMACWEPELIEAARARGTSWADLAPALGVASRQAAERRYLRLRTAPEGSAVTGEQRVAAERDRRAGDKAVAVWARANAADLRRLAGQIGALTDLGAEADGDLAALHLALGQDDAAMLLHPLEQARVHLEADHPGLAKRVGAVDRSTAEVRRASDDARRPPH